MSYHGRTRGLPNTILCTLPRLCALEPLLKPTSPSPTRSFQRSPMLSLPFPRRCAHSSQSLWRSCSLRRMIETRALSSEEHHSDSAASSGESSFLRFSGVTGIGILAACSCSASKSARSRPSGREGGYRRWRFGVDGLEVLMFSLSDGPSSSLSDLRRFLDGRGGV
jgi:hypothetical protein